MKTLISSAEYEEMYKLQNYRCKICGGFGKHKSMKKLCVDHDHKTGRIRGLLCHRCNTALGLLDDDVNKFLKAIAYLKV